MQRKMKKGADFIRKYMREDKFCTTDEERQQLIGALVGAMKWGQKTDRENVEVRKKSQSKGVLNKAYKGN